MYTIYDRLRQSFTWWSIYNNEPEYNERRQKELLDILHAQEAELPPQSEHLLFALQHLADISIVKYYIHRLNPDDIKGLRERIYAVIQWIYIQHSAKMIGYPYTSLSMRSDTVYRNKLIAATDSLIRGYADLLNVHLLEPSDFFTKEHLSCNSNYNNDVTHTLYTLLILYPKLKETTVAAAILDYILAFISEHRMKLQLDRDYEYEFYHNVQTLNIPILFAMKFDVDPKIIRALKDVWWDESAITFTEYVFPGKDYVADGSIKLFLKFLRDYRRHARLLEYAAIFSVNLTIPTHTLTAPETSATRGQDERREQPTPL